MVSSFLGPVVRKHWKDFRSLSKSSAIVSALFLRIPERRPPTNCSAVSRTSDLPKCGRYGVRNKWRADTMPAIFFLSLDMAVLLSEKGGFDILFLFRKNF